MKVKDDHEKYISYVEVEDPTAPEISFLKTACPSRKVMYVGCSKFGKILKLIFSIFSDYIISFILILS